MYRQDQTAMGWDCWIQSDEDNKGELHFWLQELEAVNWVSYHGIHFKGDIFRC